MSADRPIKIAAIGLDHAHIYGQVPGLIDAGCELVATATRDDDSAIARGTDLPTSGVAQLAVADPR